MGLTPSLSYIYGVAAALEPLNSIALEATRVEDIQVSSYTAHRAVSDLTNNTPYAPHLRASFQPAQTLLGELAKVIARPASDTLDQYEVFELKQAFDRYKTVLLADLGIVHAYFVFQKGGYDTLSLLMFGENLFPSVLLNKVPEALFDAREAGKCLAYETPTAAGFHLFRVLEVVLRKYYTLVTDGKAQPKVRNIAVYVNAMTQARKGDEKVLFLVKQIAERFRNPLIHPDAVLTLDTAFSIHGLVRTAVTEMLQFLPDVEPTTTTASINVGAN